MDNKLAVYLKGHTWVHKQSPLTKIIYIILVLAVVFWLNRVDFSLVCLFVSLTLLLVAGVWRAFLKLFLMLTVLFFFAFIINGMFYEQNQTLLFSIGKIRFFKEGFYYAGMMVLKVTNLIAAIAVLTLTSKNEDITYVLLQKGLPYSFGYMLSAVWQMIPYMMNLLKATQDAQKARGIETEGNLWQRIYAIFPALIPVIITALLSVKERAIALEVRGFKAKQKKTLLHIYRETAFDKFCQIILLLFLLLLFTRNIWLRIVS